MKLVSYGQLAYEAYRSSSGGKSLVSGAELPPWDDLPEDIRDAWCDAGHAVAQQADADSAAAAGTEPATRYARVEQMGYRSRVCTISETELAGRKMLRLTVLQTGTIHDISPDSIYEITWLTRAQAEQYTRTGAHAPAAIGSGEPPASLDDDDPWRGDPLGDVGDEDPAETDEASYHARRAAEADL